jgi:hypothetical protein
VEHEREVGQPLLDRADPVHVQPAGRAELVGAVLIVPVLRVAAAPSQGDRHEGLCINSLPPFAPARVSYAFPISGVPRALHFGTAAPVRGLRGLTLTS